MKYKNILIAFLLPVSMQSSTSLRDAVAKTLLTNPDILSYQKNNKANRLYIDEAEGAKLPKIDLKVLYQNEKTTKKETSTTDVQEGPETILTLSQNLYDGNLNYNEVLEKKHDYNENFYNNKTKTDDVIINAINTYLDLKQSQEIIKISKENITEHERILDIAKENEDISGEVIDRLQAESKVYSAYKELKDKEEDNKVALSQYKKIIGGTPKDGICRPVIFENLLPRNLNEAIALVLQKNFEIKAQLESTFKQRAVFAQEKSRFLPTIDAKFEASKDKNIENDDTTSTIYTSSITLSYNLFNGNQDIKSYQREKIFLYEAQKKLDSVTKDVKDQLRQSFTAYDISKEKIKNLTKYVKLKKDILKIYQEQFEGGTRTVIDLLSESGEYFRSRQELIVEEFQLIKNYYKMLSLFGDLADVVLDNKKEVCQKENNEGLFDFIKKDQSLALDDELAGLLEEEPLSQDSNGNGELSGLIDESNSNNGTVDSSELTESEKNEIENTKNNSDLVSSMLEKLLEEAYSNKEKNYQIIDDKSANIKPRIIGSETFKDRFLKAPKDFYTINVIAFGTMEKASEFIRKNRMSKNSFAFQFGKDLNFFKVVYGIFETYKEAKSLLELLAIPEKFYPIVEKIGNKQELYKKYNINYNIPQENGETNLDIDDTKSLSDTIKEPLDNNIEFKNRFLSEDEEKFTIDVYTFLSKKSAQDFVKDNSLYENSFIFRFGKKRRVIKLVYGIYNTINEANKDLVELKKIGDNIHPVVEKIKKQKNVYKRFHTLNNSKINKKEASTLEKPLNKVKVQVNEEAKVEDKVEKKVQDDKVLDTQKSLIEDFLSSPPENYTINIATIPVKNDAWSFVNKHNLKDKAIVFDFGEPREYTKVLYGSFKTYKDAQNALNKLDNDIMSNQPYIERVKKHQNLYKKYNKE